MNLVFWSKEHQCGTTANMLAITAALQVLYGETAVRKGCFLHKKNERIGICDCGTSMSGRRAYFLWYADLVVVHLRVDRESIDCFFKDDFYLTKKRIYVMVGYECDRDDYISYLVQVYRVEPEHIVWIPYNAMFQSAVKHGTIQTYIEKEWKQPSCFANEQLIHAMKTLVARAQLNLVGNNLWIRNREVELWNK